jgi:hypothetical protein
MTESGWEAVIGVLPIRHYHQVMAFTSSTQQREILALSFEPAEGGFVYYHNRWSRGMPVTSDEREEYLNLRVIGSRGAWRKTLIGRETVPPRAFKPVLRKLLRAMPLRMAIFGTAFGIGSLVSGLNEPNWILATLYVAAGCMMLFFGGAIFAARFWKPNGGVG